MYVDLNKYKILPLRLSQRPAVLGPVRSRPVFGWHWHYVSNTTCPTRPRLFYALFIVSRIILICTNSLSLLKNPCVKQVVLDKSFPLTQAAPPPVRSAHQRSPHVMIQWWVARRERTTGQHDSEAHKGGHRPTGQSVETLVET